MDNYNRKLAHFTGLLILNMLLYSVTYARFNQPSSFPDRIILNLTENSSTSIAITWRTDTSVLEGECEFQMAGKTALKSNSQNIYKAKTTTVTYKFDGQETVVANQHSFVKKDLKPGVKYLYRVGVPGFYSEWFEFQMPAIDNKFSFVYFGDPQTDLKSQWSRVVRKAYQLSPDCGFMLYGGDIINRAGSDEEWSGWFDAGSYLFSTIPQVLTPGNHDYNGLVLDSHWKYQFSQPQNGPNEVLGTCFFVDYKNLKIISIDSAVESELEDENGKALKSQKVWLDSILALNTKKWVIVTTHLPFYSTKESRDNAHIRKHFQGIIEKYGVDMVLTGHDHSYGRGTASENKTLKPSIVYVVSVSGPKLYEAGNKNWLQVKGNNVQLFQQITIDNNLLSYKAFTADGQLFDQFDIKKKNNGTNKFIERNQTNRIKNVARLVNE